MLARVRRLYIFLERRIRGCGIGKKWVRVPVLVRLGVCANGQRVVLDLRLSGVESEQA